MKNMNTKYEMVTLYAVRGRWDGRDIVEGCEVTVKTTDGREVFGLLQDVGYEQIKVCNPDKDETYEIPYSDIKDISD